MQLVLHDLHLPRLITIVAECVKKFHFSHLKCSIAEVQLKWNKKIKLTIHDYTSSWLKFLQIIVISHNNILPYANLTISYKAYMHVF